MGMILLIIGSLLLLVGGLWLIFVAFGESAWIGFATLFIPFFFVYTMFRRWPFSRVPTALMGAGFALILASLLFAPQIPATPLTDGLNDGPEVAWSEKRNVRGGSVPRPAGFEYDPAVPESTTDEPTTEESNGADSTEPETADAETAEEEPTESAQFQRSGLRGSETVSPSRIGEYVGRYITVVRRDGERIQGTIQKVDGSTITMRRRIGGGTISFRLKRSDIEKLYVPRQNR